jgi:23S rRNA (pseudouridine1915-N3)-methyltransferase
MKWQIIVVGKPSLPWARQGVEDYAARLRNKASVEIVHLREGPPAQVGQKALETSEGSWRIVLDEKGKQMSSVALAQWIEKQELSGRKRVSLLIGGADGHPPEVKHAADELWSLSEMTLQHELALVVLMEQIYRACSINRGEPYHRV